MSDALMQIARIVLHIKITTKLIITIK
uniref:Uncharacterized protein n=1 Tax=Anguilla anguilla TaxID=7936 RepID=A0A0E9RL38_ANGAN